MGPYLKRWGFRPQKVVRMNIKRRVLSVISTVANKGQMRRKTFDGALNSTVLIDFLRGLIRPAGRRIYLILDQLLVHHSKPVKAWMAEHEHEIEVFYLPSYRPALNPDEAASADLKQAATKQAPVRTKLQLVKPAARHLRSVQRPPERIKSSSSMGRFGVPLDSSSLMPTR